MDDTRQSDTITIENLASHEISRIKPVN